MTTTRQYLIVIVLLLATAVGLQIWRDRGWQAYEPSSPVMWLRAGAAAPRMVLGYDALAADLYWIRAVVYFGRESMSRRPDKDFWLLYPLLDLVTTLDPRFVVAYRFGAIFLSEPPPDGPGRPDDAIRLLERGANRFPERWEYPHDLAFVHYWHRRDSAQAAEWMARASEVPGSPFWLKSSAAAMHTESGNRQSARTLWEHLRDSADNDLLRQTAELRIAQFEAMDAIDELNVIVWRFQARTGRVPATWREVVAAGLIRGIPLDPTGVAYEIDQIQEDVRVAPWSPLHPIPDGFTAPQ